MTPPEIHTFARNLMREVWEPFDVSKLDQFYHRDVIGHHRAQAIHFPDIENRLAWDRKTREGQAYHIKDIIAEDNRFSIRFVFTTTELPTGENAEIEVIYFYHLRDGKIAEFWLLAGVDFDYLERA